MERDARKLAPLIIACVPGMTRRLRGASPRSRYKRSRRKGDVKGVVARRGLKEAQSEDTGDEQKAKAQRCALGQALGLPFRSMARRLLACCPGAFYLPGRQGRPPANTPCPVREGWIQHGLYGGKAPHRPRDVGRKHRE